MGLAVSGEVVGHGLGMRRPRLMSGDLIILRFTR